MDTTTLKYGMARNGMVWKHWLKTENSFDMLWQPLTEKLQLFWKATTSFWRVTELSKTKGKAAGWLSALSSGTSSVPNLLQNLSDQAGAV